MCLFCNSCRWSGDRFLFCFAGPQIRQDRWLEKKGGKGRGTCWNSQLLSLSWQQRDGDAPPTEVSEMVVCQNYYNFLVLL